MSKIEKLIEVMANLRDPQRGCPWDLEQSFETIVPHTIEEAYEVAEAVETGDREDLCGELGDLLFQVVFYARLAEEERLFDFNQIVERIVEKLVSRHPHVFGDEKMENSETQSLAWESHKARERAGKWGDNTTLSGIATTLPSLTRAIKLQKRAAQVGFDWPTIKPVFDKVIEELDEVKEEINRDSTDNNNQQHIEEEIGDLLFACTNLSRFARINPETALRRSNRKFEKRFSRMEAIATEKSLVLEKLDIAMWDQLWEQVKTEENS